MDQPVVEAGKVRCVRQGVPHYEAHFFGGVGAVVSGLFPVVVAGGELYPWH